MVFERALRRELSQAALGVFVALSAIVVVTQLVRLLNDAAGGRIAPEAVAALLGFTALQFLPTLLSLTLFIAILMTLSRQYRDSEMVIWFASGRSLFAWAGPVFRFSLPVVAVIAAIAFVFGPWAQVKSQEYRQDLAARSETTHLAPGAFRESADGQRVLYVEHLDEDEAVVRGVFVRSEEKGGVVIVRANEGVQTIHENGDRFVRLEGGRRYEYVRGGQELKTIEFGRYFLRVEEKERRQEILTPRQMSSLQLWQGDARELAELVWRASLPLSALVLALLAIPLSYVNPRAGRSWGVVVAILVFLTYNNMLSVVQSWVARGKMLPEVAVWAPHVVILAVFVLLTWRQVAIRIAGRWAR